MKTKGKQQMRIWAMLCHFSALFSWLILFALVFLGIPLYLPLNILLPLSIWQLKKNQYPWIDFQGRESLNFQISLTLYTLVFIIISLLLVFGSCSIAITNHGAVNEFTTVLDALLLMWMFLIIGLLLLQSFLVSFAAMKAYHGEHYRYPFTMRILR
ncbi:DUF4870 domain-containing protein [Nostoc sp. FACHB-152]|uniref:DUF4870 domain-containing protein n=1 Tax=unclassified Nostoc TaxID=2593658 RepID=UPI001689DCA4|nr:MULTISPECIES: DUF4870 domain-containing protein [unclassified Nostoc]MBD2448514.1 DUF4870 domain-containing protein [Nostoc sp. FACHB-152]MBD2466251.1 DUF4870 domain-containing protein [Nostoc sp. FACHB-145]